MHDRKKGGERKDHKNKKMHESVDLRHALHEAKTEKPTSDQNDVIDYKQGGPSDANRRQSHIPKP
jgi:hypothetical protein